MRTSSTPQCIGSEKSSHSHPLPIILIGISLNEQCENSMMMKATLVGCFVLNTKSFVYSFNTHGLFGLSAWFVNLLLCARVSGHRPKVVAKFEVERGGAGSRFPIPGALTLRASIYLLEFLHSEHLIKRRILRRTSWYPGC